MSAFSAGGDMGGGPGGGKAGFLAKAKDAGAFGGNAAPAAGGASSSAAAPAVAAAAAPAAADARGPVLSGNPAGASPVTTDAEAAQKRKALLGA
jgi:hypothetical protein